jgi:hypothetical protein
MISVGDIYFRSDFCENKGAQYLFIKIIDVFSSENINWIALDNHHSGSIRLKKLQEYIDNNLFRKVDLEFVERFNKMKIMK